MKKLTLNEIIAREIEKDMVMLEAQMNEKMAEIKKEYTTKIEELRTRKHELLYD